MSPIAEAVRRAAAEVVDPCSAAAGCGMNLVEMGLLRGAALEGGTLRVELGLTSPGCLYAAIFAQELEDRLAGLPEVEEVVVEVQHDAAWSEDAIEPAALERLRTARRDRARRRWATP